jgi:hypothetical protein
MGIACHVAWYSEDNIHQYCKRQIGRKRKLFDIKKYTHKKYVKPARNLNYYRKSGCTIKICQKGFSSDGRL